MGGATRFLMLLATPLPPRFPSLQYVARIHHHRYLHHLSSVSSHSLHRASQRRKASLPINCTHSQQFHSQTGTVRDDRQYLSDSYAPSSIGAQHLWPEWLNLLESLSTEGYFKEGLGGSLGEDSSKDEFVSDVELSEEFARAARGCLAFARDRPHLFVTLARTDIKILVENGTPFLFKNANDSILKMRCFLDGDKSTGIGMERAQTVDLMRYILSYTYNPSISGETPDNGLIMSSVRNLLRELANLCSPSTGSQFNSIDSTAQNQYPGGYGQVPKPHLQNIEMKRGDWLCPRCSFMNFARNLKCLECAETRPKRQLSGGEWECPQCDFHNYSRNVACLRCDCKRPAQLSGVPTGNYTSRDFDNRLSANEEKAQRWFNKVSQMDSSTADPNTAIADEDFPEIMPLRKGVNRFVVSTRKTPLERRLADAQRQRGSEDGSNSNSVDQGINSSYSPFVPLPADMFANKPASSGSRSEETTVNRNEDVGLNSQEQISTNPSEGARLDQAQEGKTDGWFKRIVDLHDSPELTSATSDTDFPGRNGDNRFVVSKRGDRSLTSPMYKRQAAMEQTKSSNFVPFVPFPPDYFSNKEVKNSNNEAVVEKEANGSNNREPPKQTKDIRASTPGKGQIQTIPSTSSQPLNSSYSWTGKSLEGSAVKETDPLDMSEEAKAERWFRRVAQIKDISELSQIPDEDFPSIMPMRKGVNRFVVSKRKTPLERRLTSSQYRRNLPVVSSDPPKKEDDDRNQ